MELSNVQSALTSLEERFHQLRILGEQQLQESENTIANLQQELAAAISNQQATEAKLQACESAQRNQETAHEQELTDIHKKLAHRHEEVDHLRIRCEVLLQQAKRVELLEDEVQRLNNHIKQNELEDQELYDQLIQSFDENKAQRVLVNELQIKLKHSNEACAKLATLLSKKQHLLGRLFQLGDMLPNTETPQKGISVFPMRCQR